MSLHDLPQERSGPPPPVAPEELDDATLAARAGDGDVAALETLFRRYQQRMYRAARRILGDPRDAEDAVQEAFVSAWRRLDSYRGEASFSSWLYRIVTNRCLTMTRSRHRDLTPLDAVERVVAASASRGPEAEATVSAGRDALQAALMELPAEQRTCWVLRENDGLGYVEIADIVGSSPDAVRGQIHRARVTLMGRMRAWR
jgi:RNA polymerase sigma-70 factor (ECF subfamily)